MTNYLCHHGILGQREGVQHGPPYPLSRQDKDERESIKNMRAFRKVYGFDARLVDPKTHELTEAGVERLKLQNDRYYRKREPKNRIKRATKNAINELHGYKNGTLKEGSTITLTERGSAFGGEKTFATISASDRKEMMKKDRRIFKTYTLTTKIKTLEDEVVESGNAVVDKILDMSGDEKLKRYSEILRYVENDDTPYTSAAAKRYKKSVFGKNKRMLAQKQREMEKDIRKYVDSVINDPSAKKRLIEKIHEEGYNLSIDPQAFVRNIGNLPLMVTADTSEFAQQKNKLIKYWE